MNGIIEYNAKDNHASLNALINNNAGLKAYLGAQRFGQYKNPINYSSPNRIVFEHIYNYFYPENHPERPKDFSKLLECLGLLSSIRNNIAHSMQGVTIKDMNAKLKDKKIEMGDFNKMLSNYFAVPLNTLPPYDAVNKHLHHYLGL